MLPWIGDYQWQIWLHGGFLGVLIFPIGIYIIVMVLNITQLPKLLPEIVGWLGFLLTVSGATGLMLCAIYIALRILIQNYTGIAIYELFMIVALGAIIIGYFTIMMNSKKGRMEIRWQFFEQRIELHNAFLGQLSFLVLKVGIIGLLVWGGWVAQELDILKLDLLDLNHFTRTLLYSTFVVGLGQVLKIGGHDSYLMSIIDGILVLRFEFAESPKRKKIR